MTIRIDRHCPEMISAKRSLIVYGSKIYCALSEKSQLKALY